MILEDVTSFRLHDISKRLLSGGLPPFSVQKEISGTEVQEWVDSFWAKDIQELFRVEKRDVTVEFLGLNDAIERFSGIK
jgi:uncharacterized protein